MTRYTIVEPIDLKLALVSLVSKSAAETGVAAARKTVTVVLKHEGDTGTFEAQLEVTGWVHDQDDMIKLAGLLAKPGEKDIRRHVMGWHNLKTGDGTFIEKKAGMPPGIDVIERLNPPSDDAVIVLARRRVLPPT